MRTALVMALMFYPAALRAQGMIELQQALNAAASKAAPAVVSVQVVREETQSVVEPEYYFGYAFPSEKLYRYDVAGVGSGVIIDERGYVLTNLHVVEGAARIKVVAQDARGKEREWMTSVAGTDPALDIALLKIKGAGPFPALKLASSGGLKIGDLVIAVGYPFGFGQTFTSGIISALNARLPVEGRRYEKLIQTDAAINRGNSGGPLLNLNGEVIGVNTAIASPNGVFAGMGFAVPASEIKRVLDDLLAGREIRRGWLGVSVLGIDGVMAARLGLSEIAGVLVNNAVQDSPAWKAGVRRGDVILSCDGEPVESNEDLFLKTFSRRPGDEVELVWQRGAVKKTARVKLGDRDRAPGSRARGKVSQAVRGGGLSWEGVSLVYDGGALVAGVAPDSRLNGYLRSGDLVLAVNGKPVQSAAGMEKAFSAASISEGVVFDLVRDGEASYLSVQNRN